MPRQPHEPLVRLERVSLAYTQGMDALKDITLTLERGSFHFLSGPSGAGKSSLLSLLSLLQAPTRGRIHLFGQDTKFLRARERAHFRRRIGVVYQDYRLLDHLTVAENVGLPLKLAGELDSVVKPKVDELLEWVGLSVYAKARPSILSGGQKQRVAIARAVITKPDLLLADEPTGNLDPELSLRFMYLFQALHSWGTAVVFATHDEQLLAEGKHPILTLKDGRLQQQKQTGKAA